MELKLEDLLSVVETFDEEELLTFKAKRVEMQFIKNLIKERKKKGLSQRDLASRTGLTQQVISSIEKCDRRPTLSNLIKYLLGLGIDINTVFKQ